MKMIPLVLTVVVAICANLRAKDDPEAAPAPLPNFDKRRDAQPDVSIEAGKRAAAKGNLQARVPKVEIKADAITGSPELVSSVEGFLTGPNGRGRGVSDQANQGLATDDPAYAVKNFLQEYRDLYGHGPEILQKASVKRDYVTAHNGLRTIMWEQQVEGIPVHGGMLVGHITKNKELVNLSSHFLPDPEAAADAGAKNRKDLSKNPPISIEKAIALASANLDEPIDEAVLPPLRINPGGLPDIKKFKGGPLADQAQARLTWLPMNRSTLRLCWQVAIKRKADARNYQCFVDAQTGEVVARQGMTMDLTDVSYRVYTGASPAPWLPGPATPTSAQAGTVPRQLVTLSALNTTASPLGWINDGDNQTRGNNIFACVQTPLETKIPYGTANRVFDYPLDLTQAPANYVNASTVNAFYWGNFLHDKMYDFGFTEAAGNYQKDNFGRGGADSDMMFMIVQQGILANSYFDPYYIEDGEPGYIHCFVWPLAEPDRDGALDAQVLLHEYHHGVQQRLCPSQSAEANGMFEGWSDFNALALLSQATDDPNGTYPVGAYVTYLMADGNILTGFDRNYYYGIRRYPYSTDLTKNPLTYNDIEGDKAYGHPGLPRNPFFVRSAEEVHKIGEVWCSILWDARAALVQKYGFTVGNQKMMQLVMDGMRLLGPGSMYGFTQARDRILQADQVNNAGANANELWAAFAKRGLGASASSYAYVLWISASQAFDVPAGTRKLMVHIRGQDAAYLTMPMFAAEEIRALPNLAAALYWPSTSLSTYLWSRLSPATQPLVANYVNSQYSTDPNPVTQALVADFDRILKEGPLYDANRFAGVRLSDETQWWLAQNPQGGGLVRLNRLLLDDAYVTLITPSLPLGSENAGTITAGGTVRITQTLGSDLVVTLASSQPGNMTVPASVTIPAGQLQANFNVTVVNNSLSDGKHYGFVTATASGLSSAAAGLQIMDDEVDHFDWNVIASPQQVNQAFSVSVTAKDAQNSTVTTFQGPVQLGGWAVTAAPKIVISKVHISQEATASGLAASGYVEFANALGADVTLDNWQIVLYDKTLWPDPQQTIVLPASSTSHAGEKFILSIRPLASAQASYPGAYPSFATYAGVAWHQGAGSNPIAVLLRDASGNIVDFVCAADAVASQITVPATIPTSVWSGAAIPAFSTVPGFYQRFGNADHNNRTDWFPASMHDAVIPNLVLTTPLTGLQPAAISPTTSGTFVGGIWNGTVTVPGLANNLMLRADDTFNHSGNSGTFSVSVANDIAVTVATSPSRVTPGNLLTYTITVANTGPGAATLVSLSDTAPAGTTVESVSTTQGSCSVNSGVVTCSLGTLSGSASATVTLGVRVGGVGTVVNTATISRGETDAYTANNSIVTSSSVSLPLIIAGHVTVTEGNSGTTIVSVPVTLSGSNTVAVSVNYATLQYPAGARVATAGVDYTSSSGTITFLPGVTTATLSLQVTGDTLAEDLERFGLVLSGPVNAELAASRYRIQITDDDSSTQPNMSIADTSVVEGDAGTTTAIFNITLSIPSGRDLNVSYYTTEGTALEFRDFDPVSGSLVIPAGITAASFSVPVRGDTYFEGNETFTVSIFAGFANVVKSVGVCTIIDDDANKLRDFNLSSVASPQNLNCAFPVTVTARDGAGNTYSSFNGSASIRGRVPGPTVTIGIAPSLALGDIVNLQSFALRLKYPDPNYDPETIYLKTRLSQATLDLLSSYSSGESAPLRSALVNDLNTIIAGVSIYDPNRFYYVALRPETDALRLQNPQGALLARLNRLLLEDAYPDLAQFEWSYPLGTFFEDQRVQVIYRASEIGQAGQIGSVALKVDRPPSMPPTGWTIRMKHTTLANYPANPQWEGTGWTTVFQGASEVYSNDWVAFHFSTPFSYNGTDNLLVDFTFNNSDYLRSGLCTASSDMVPRALVTETDSSSGNPLDWSGTTPLPLATNRYPHLRLFFETPVAITPGSIGPFVNGAWTGQITVNQLATGMQLLVNDGNNHVGAGNTFDVLNINATPSFVKGPDQTVLKNSAAQTVSGWATSISAGPGESWQTVNFIVSNNNNPLFSVQPGVAANGTLTFTPAANMTGSATVTVQIHDNGGSSCGGSDTSAAQTFVISVTPYTVTVTANIPAAEEPDNYGSHNGQFTITRSGGDNSAAMTVYYSVGGTATSGSDYSSLGISATISAGQASALVTVTVLDDSLYEWNETVILTLSPNAAYVVGGANNATVTINSFFDLGVIPGTTSSKSFSLNSSARLVGSSDSSSVTKAFRSVPNQPLSSSDDLHPEISQFFGNPGLGSSVAWDISDADKTVGEWTYGGTTKAWYRYQYYYGGTYQQLNAPNSTQNYIRAVVDTGTSGYSQGAGYSTVNGYNQFCHWIIYDSTPSSTYVYNIGGMWPSLNSYAMGLLQNKIIGFVAYPAGNKALIWDWAYSGSGPTYLIGPAGATQTEAYDVNMNGYYTMIVGYSEASSLKTACYWWYSSYNSAGITATLLGKPTGWNHAVAQGLNSNNKIVGNYFQAYSPLPQDRRASVWDAGTLIQLNAIVPVESGWVLNSAEKINGYNQIAGYGTLGGQFHAFRLKQ